MAFPSWRLGREIRGAKMSQRDDDDDVADVARTDLSRSRASPSVRRPFRHFRPPTPNIDSRGRQIHLVLTTAVMIRKGCR